MIAVIRKKILIFFKKSKKSINFASCKKTNFYGNICNEI